MSMSTDSTNYTRPSHLIALLAIAMTACAGVESDRDAARRGELQVIASAHAVGDPPSELADFRVDEPRCHDPIFGCGNELRRSSELRRPTARIRHRPNTRRSRLRAA